MYFVKELLFLLITPLGAHTILVYIASLPNYSHWGPWYAQITRNGSHKRQYCSSWSILTIMTMIMLMMITDDYDHHANDDYAALAVQRYIYVCHAAVAKQWCTLARSLSSLSSSSLSTSLSSLSFHQWCTLARSSSSLSPLSSSWLSSTLSLSFH